MELRRILIVDDEPDVLAVTCRLLARRGRFEVLGVESGEAALAALPSFRPDLVLLDVCMPGMDGPATVAALREAPFGKGLPIVFCTASGITMKEFKAQGVEVIAVIAKPYYAPTLGDELAEMYRTVRS